MKKIIAILMIMFSALFAGCSSNESADSVNTVIGESQPEVVTEIVEDVLVIDEVAAEDIELGELI